MRITSSKRVAILLACGATSILASPLRPELTALIQGGNTTTFWGSVLEPLFASKDKVTFFDLQLEHNHFSQTKNPSIFSLGFGQRALRNHHVIGGYLFADVAETAANERYFVLSPGADYYKGAFSVAVNGYVPVGSSHMVDGRYVHDGGDEDYRDIQSNGDNSYNVTYGFYDFQEQMQYGGDLSFGYHPINSDWGGKIGLYHFGRSDTRSRQGEKMQLNYAASSHVQVRLEDRFDNLDHNRVLVGAVFSFGHDLKDRDLRAQLTAPIYRNLDVNTTDAGLGSGYQRLNRISDEQNFAHAYLIGYSSIPTGAGVVSTYTQAKDREAHDNNNNGYNDAAYLFEGGRSYNVDFSTTGHVLTGSQSIIGVTEGFHSISDGGVSAPTLISAQSKGIDVQSSGEEGSTGGVLEGFKLELTNASATDGITIDATSAGERVSIKNVSVSDQVATGDLTGIEVAGGADVAINNVTLNLLTKKETQPLLQGVNVTGNTNVAISGGVFNLRADKAVANIRIKGVVNTGSSNTVDVDGLALSFYKNTGGLYFNNAVGGTKFFRNNSSGSITVRNTTAKLYSDLSGTLDPSALSADYFSSGNNIISSGNKFNDTDV